MQSVSKYTMFRASPYLICAIRKLAGRRYMTARRLGRLLGVCASTAGSVLVVLGWRKISHRTYERREL